MAKKILFILYLSCNIITNKNNIDELIMHYAYPLCILQNGSIVTPKNIYFWIKNNEYFCNIHSITTKNIYGIELINNEIKRSNLYINSNNNISNNDLLSNTIIGNENHDIFLIAKNIEINKENKNNTIIIGNETTKLILSGDITIGRNNNPISLNGDSIEINVDSLHSNIIIGNHTTKTIIHGNIIIGDFLETKSIISKDINFIISQNNELKIITYEELYNKIYNEIKSEIYKELYNINTIQ